MSIFGDLDVDSIPDDPNAIADGTYEAVITKADVALTKAGDKTGLTIGYSITTEGDYEGRDLQEWKQIPSKADYASEDADVKKKATTQASYLKQRMLDLGVDPATAGPDDLVGINVAIVVKNSNGYRNINKVEVLEDSAVDTANPFGL